MANRIVIEVGGGAVCEVYCDDPTAEVVLVDWGTDGCEPGDHYVHEIADGRLVLVVPGYPTSRSATMPDDTRTALERAGSCWPTPTRTGAPQENG